MRTALILGGLPLLCCIPVSQESGAQRWRSHAEVYELSTRDGVLFAKTSGGVMSLRDGRWVSADSMPEASAAPEIAAKGDGAFLSATTQYQDKTIASFWGGKSIYAVEGDTATELFPRPPAEGDYALTSLAGLLYAGTNRGLFVRAGDAWKRIDLGGELPFPRVHGIARSGSRYVVGGIEGLVIGAPGDWKEISGEPVRQLLQAGEDVWILYGSGAVDKLTASGELFSDVLHGAARRPWTSSMAASPGGLLLGGLGGWVQKGTAFVEKYPAALSGEVTTAILAKGESLLVGTQGKGLLRIDQGREAWLNPGTGLLDTWVTALCLNGGTPVAATATAGLFEIRGNRAHKISSPSDKLRHLTVYKGRLVAGALDGAWIRNGSNWEELETDSLETTCLTVIGSGLWVGTPRGLFRFQR